MKAATRRTRQNRRTTVGRALSALAVAGLLAGALTTGTAAGAQVLDAAARSVGVQTTSTSGTDPSTLLKGSSWAGRATTTAPTVTVTPTTWSLTGRGSSWG